MERRFKADCPDAQLGSHKDTLRRIAEGVVFSIGKLLFGS